MEHPTPGYHGDVQACGGAPPPLELLERGITTDVNLACNAQRMLNLTDHPHFLFINFVVRSNVAKEHLCNKCSVSMSQLRLFSSRDAGSRALEQV